MRLALLPVIALAAACPQPRRAAAQAETAKQLHRHPTARCSDELHRVSGVLSIRDAPAFMSGPSLWAGCGKLLVCGQMATPNVTVPLGLVVVTLPLGAGEVYCVPLSATAERAFLDAHPGVGLGRVQHPPAPLPDPVAHGLVVSGSRGGALTARAFERSRELKERLDAAPTDERALWSWLEACEQTREWPEAQVAWRRFLASPDATGTHRLAFAQWSSEHGLDDADGGLAVEPVR